MEGRASRLFRTKRIKQSSVSCDNNNNEIASPITSNKIEDAAVDKSHTRATSTTPTSTKSIQEQQQYQEISKQLKKMSNDELKRLLVIEDDMILDCIIARTPTIRKLEQERDTLKEQVLNLAYCNHAREPEFVRDRLKLRELTRDVTQLIKHISCKHIEPIVNKLKFTEKKLVQLARKHEEESEAVAQRFLEAPRSEQGHKGNDDAGSAGNNDDDDENRVHVFTRDYIEIRKRAIKKRTLADRLAKELDLLSNSSSIVTAMTSASLTTTAATKATTTTTTTTQQGRHTSPVRLNIKLG